MSEPKWIKVTQVRPIIKAPEENGGPEAPSTQDSALDGEKCQPPPPTRPRPSAILPWEDLRGFEELTNRLFADLRPMGELELSIFRDVVLATWRLKRCDEIEAGLVAAENLSIARKRAKRARQELLVPYDLTKLLGGDPSLRRTAEPVTYTEEQMAAADIVTDDRGFIFRPDQMTDARAFEGTSRVLHELQRSRKNIQEARYRDLRELKKLQAKRLALPKAALELQFDDVHEEILRRQAQPTESPKKRSKKRLKKRRTRTKPLEQATPQAGEAAPQGRAGEIESIPDNPGSSERLTENVNDD